MIILIILPIVPEIFSKNHSRSIGLGMHLMEKNMFEPHINGVFLFGQGANKEQ
jgi:hypothetical protein